MTTFSTTILYFYFSSHLAVCWSVTQQKLLHQLKEVFQRKTVSLLVLQKMGKIVKINLEQNNKILSYYLVPLFVIFFYLLFSLFSTFSCLNFFVLLLEKLEFFTMHRTLQLEKVFVCLVCKSVKITLLRAIKEFTVKVLQ